VLERVADELREADTALDRSLSRPIEKGFVCLDHHPSLHC
jgi:hypothetical protein